MWCVPYDTYLSKKGLNKDVKNRWLLCHFVMYRLKIAIFSNFGLSQMSAYTGGDTEKKMKTLISLFAPSRYRLQ